MRRLKGHLRHPQRILFVSGFSMPELMIVVAIIGILSGVTISLSGTEWRRERVNSQALQLAGWLDSVRQLAQRQQGSGCTVTLSSGPIAGGGVLAQINSTASPLCASRSPEPQLLAASIEAGSTFTVTPTATTLVFTPRGTTTNAANVDIGIVLTGQTPQRCVRVTPIIGMIRIGRNDGSSNPSNACAIWSDSAPF